MINHTNITPAFVRIAEEELDLSHGGEDFRAYFMMDYPPRLIGLIRYGDDLPMDRTYAIYWVGSDTVKRWEQVCDDMRPEWQDDDPREQAGYDAAKEARYAS